MPCPAQILGAMTPTHLRCHPDGGPTLGPTRDLLFAVAATGQKKMQIPRTASRAPENRGKTNNARDSARDGSREASACG